VQRLLRGNPELVEHDGAQAQLRRAVVVGVARVGDDELAHERVAGEDGRLIEAEGFYVAGTGSRPP
jgi:hypothetical protein